VAATTRIETVDPEGFLRFRVDSPPGARLRVIVEEMETGPAADHGEFCGFVRDVLGAPAEDVWNDL